MLSALQLKDYVYEGNFKNKIFCFYMYCIISYFINLKTLPRNVNWANTFGFSGPEGSLLWG